MTPEKFLIQVVDTQSRFDTYDEGRTKGQRQDEPLTQHYLHMAY